MHEQDAFEKTGNNIIKDTIMNISILIFGLAFILIGQLIAIEKGYQSYLGKNEAYFLTGNLTGIPILSGLILLVIIIWLISPKGVFGIFNSKGVPRISKVRILAGSILMHFILVIGSMMTYEKYTLDDIEVNTFGIIQEYKWKEVDCVTLKADLQGVLIFEVQLDNGKRYSFNGGILHAVEYESDAFDIQFPDGIYDFAISLSGKWAKEGVQLKPETKLMSKLKYESWKELADEVLQEYELQKSYNIYLDKEN